MATLAPMTDSPRLTAPYRIDVSRGHMSSRVSSEWFSRPDDEKYLSLTSLYDAVRSRAVRATTRIVESRSIRVEAKSDNPERLMLMAPGDDRPLVPTNWSFGQVASLVGAPASYLRQLPAALAGINLQHGLINHRGEQVKLLQTENGRTELQAATGSEYGRIFDWELVQAVMAFASDGVGDTRWKVPGTIDWGSMTYNPYVDITRETTTLYASDRDIFLFLVDDTHPSRRASCLTAIPTSIFAASTPGTARLARRPLGSRPFTYAAYAPTAVCGASKISRRSISATRNSPPPVLPIMPHLRLSISQTLRHRISSPASRPPASGSSRARTRTANPSCANAAFRRPRRQRSSRPCWLKKAVRLNPSMISSRV